MSVGNAIFTISPVLGVECKCGELLLGFVSPTGENTIHAKVACFECRQRWNIHGTLMRTIAKTQQPAFQIAVKAARSAGDAFLRMYDLKAQEVSD